MLQLQRPSPITCMQLPQPAQNGSLATVWRGRMGPRSRQRPRGPRHRMAQPALRLKMNEKWSKRKRFSTEIGIKVHGGDEIESDCTHSHPITACALPRYCIICTRKGQPEMNNDEDMAMKLWRWWIMTSIHEHANAIFVPQSRLHSGVRRRKQRWRRNGTRTRRLGVSLADRQLSQLVLVPVRPLDCRRQAARVYKKSRIAPFHFAGYGSFGRYEAGEWKRRRGLDMLPPGK